MSALYEKAREFARLFPNRPASRTSGTWDQLCGIHMIQFGGWLGGATAQDMIQLPSVGVKPFWLTGTVGSIASAKVVGDHSGWLNPKSEDAPIGAFHFWAIGLYDHVAMDLNGGGIDNFMVTRALREEWGAGHIGVQSVKGYVDAKGARYRGWATNYTGGTIRLPAEVPPRPDDDVKRVAGYLNTRRLVWEGKVLSSSAVEDGKPGKNLYLMIQVAGRADGLYPEPLKIDGITGPRTEAAFDHYVELTKPKPPAPQPTSDPVPTPEPEPEPEPTPEPEPPVEQPEPEPPVVVPVPPVTPPDSPADPNSEKPPAKDTESHPLQTVLAAIGTLVAMVIALLLSSR